MNWNQGLRRISAVAWGCVAAFAAIVVWALAWDEARANGVAQAIGYGIAIGIFAFGLILLAHRVTCWVIDGFFTSK
jgi:hypothetical protein